MNITLATVVVFVSSSITNGQALPVTNYLGFVVVELFTSEGCSSCPPADAVLTDIAHKYPGHVIPLSFHVDYWDRLGWKDRYSSSAFSNRQYKYASAAHSDGVFTPEVIVNGKSHFVGSKQQEIEAEISKSLSVSLPSSIDFQVKTSNGGKQVAVSYQCTAAKGQLINIALVQRQSMDKISSGENSGRRLIHTNNVRDLIISKNIAGTVYFTIPAELSAGDCAIAIFTQWEQTMAITASTELISINK
jgi:hypothetical protein